MFSDEMLGFVEAKIRKHLKIGGYKPKEIKWSGSHVAVWIPGFKGHHSVFHGVWRDIEKSVWKRFRKRITLYLRRFSEEATLRTTHSARSNSWHWFNDVWAKGQRRCWGINP